ncbi:hypothetical protein BBO99_00008284 [Phytophthora kernoviae]|uniref:Uncharacterized protein n=2 Tax=Phytophthora kernoviae TaxID=325452 RepID=A0A3R7IQ64_9STRA|nr:hypothetical protein G195_008116 [Phytophthora kernoviae 00238/432]KAG2521143.1 hypothetical protein JM16_006394 [Phytophthora kernoviae]KAG2522248.1 hypothetical protein JM18_006248 [Phytophthora kernoviae]RLN45360.1 hypothetical protein BBI17_008170 [Phytophthora kernoviae]RLN75480.1 hypothetical protein BBO99_00008284 [Phytophthora kernoviae]
MVKEIDESTETLNKTEDAEERGIGKDIKVGIEKLREFVMRATIKTHLKAGTNPNIVFKQLGLKKSTLANIAENKNYRYYGEYLDKYYKAAHPSLQGGLLQSIYY